MLHMKDFCRNCNIFTSEVKNNNIVVMTLKLDNGILSTALVPAAA